MGVWIEIYEVKDVVFLPVVTPCVGVWIEILCVMEDLYESASLPAWECGLKSGGHVTMVGANSVTPCVGVWIEINFASETRSA